MLVTRREVLAGEEVTLDYDFEAGDWRQACQCSTPECRGWLHLVPAGQAGKLEEQAERAGEMTEEEAGEAKEGEGDRPGEEVLIISDGSA